MKKSDFIAAVLIAAASSMASAATPVAFGDRSVFNAAAGMLSIDDYEDPAYAEFQDDAHMNAVKGLTRYQTSGPGLANFDEVINFGTGKHIYAGGFTSGSFLLDFTAASLGGTGVHAVGFEYINAAAAPKVPYVAFVSFADGTSQNFALPTLHPGVGIVPPLAEFFGLTSSSAITRIHIGLPDGAAAASAVFALDNLSVSAPVPEPASAAMLGIGVLAFTLARRRRA